MYLDDTRHYHAIPELAPTIMEGFRAFHTKLGLARFHKFDNTKSVPYSYILVKAKDINRSRPIVSYLLQPPTQENLQLRLPRPIFHPKTPR